MTESTKKTRRAAPDATHTPRSATEAAIRRRARFSTDDAHALETYYAEHESAMGARSTLLGTIQQLQTGGPPQGGTGRNGVETAMVARMGRVQGVHRPIERALARLTRWHRDVLWLAHGCLPKALPPQVVSEFGMAAGVALAMPELAARHAEARRHATNVPAEAPAWLLQLCAAREEAALAEIAVEAEAHLGAAHAAFREARKATREESPKARAAREQAERDREAAERQRKADARKAKRRAELAAIYGGQRG